MLNLPLKYYFETEKYEILEFEEILVIVFVFFTGGCSAQSIP